MRSSWLRIIRIVLSLIIFICFFAIFVDFKYLIPSGYVSYILFPQFVPSAIKFYHTGTLIASGFIFVLLLTFFTGRTYCSFLCPLGVMQDIFSRVGGRFKKRFRRYGYKKPLTVLRYFILAITVIVTLIWGLYMVTLLDPYSIFGRFMTYFVKPCVILANNFFAGILGKFDIYTFSHIPVKGFSLVLYSIPVAFFILVGILSLTKGRLYCNTVCPVGTLLGLFAKISIFRIRLDNSECSRCGKCTLGCKASCIDFLNYSVDTSRCVGCFNCLGTCKEDAISYGPVKFKSGVSEHDEKRRGFIAMSLMMFFGLSGLSKGQESIAPKPKKDSTVPEEKNYPVSPPGSVTIKNINDNCTACSLCIEVCPNGVLEPSLSQYGILGIMQPVMNFHKSFCTYECTKCTEVCPTNALQPLALEAKKLTQLGKAIFVEDNCIVKTEETSCGACAESCPTKAVHMIPYKGNLVIPEVTDDICIGCGHCEFACPTVPYKAIFVDGNAIHKAAEKPLNKESEIEAPVDFPF